MIIYVDFIEKKIIMKSENNNINNKESFNFNNKDYKRIYEILEKIKKELKNKFKED